MAARSTISTPTARTVPRLAKNRPYPSTRAAVKKSSPHMMRCRGTRSARTPPRGEQRMVDTMDTARMPPKAAAEPVVSST